VLGVLDHDCDHECDHDDEDQNQQGRLQLCRATAHVMFPFSGLLIGQGLMDGCFGGFERGDRAGDGCERNRDDQPDAYAERREAGRQGSP